jgi:hypothetical protein
LALADDAHVSPTRIFLREAQHEADHPRVQRLAASAFGGVSPASADQLAVPAQQRRQGDQEDRPAIARQQLRQARQNHSVGRRVAGPDDLPVEHRELVAQHRDLHVLGVRRLAAADQAENLTKDKECHRAHHHGPILPAEHRRWSGY